MNGLKELGSGMLRIAAAALMFVVGVGASSSIVRGDVPTRDEALLSATVVAFTTIAVTAVVARHSRFPRWALTTGAVVLGAGAVALAALYPDLAAWKHEARSAWMTPWYPFVVAIISPRYEARGACRVDDPRAGWIFVAISVVLATVPPVVALW